MHRLEKIGLTVWPKKCLNALNKVKKKVYRLS